MKQFIQIVKKVFDLVSMFKIFDLDISVSYFCSLFKVYLFYNIFCMHILFYLSFYLENCLFLTCSKYFFFISLNCNAPLALSWAYLCWRLSSYYCYLIFILIIYLSLSILLLALFILSFIFSEIENCIDAYAYFWLLALFDFY